MYLGGRQTPWMQTPLVMWTVIHAGKPTPVLVDRMTDACENITLPQTSFANGKYLDTFYAKINNVNLTCIMLTHIFYRKMILSADQK